MRGANLDRRAVLVGMSTWIGGCWRWEPPGPALAARLEDADPIDVPELLLAAGLTLSQAAGLAAGLAASRCSSEAADGFGSVSHALLRVAAAARLSRDDWPRWPAPLLEAAWFVAREVRSSPYVETPWRLPEPPQPGVALERALTAGDVVGVDACVAANSSRAVPLLARAATAQLGHLGHPAIFVASALSLGGDVMLWRSVARYLASFRAPDDTDARISAARAGGGQSTASEVVRWLESGMAASSVADRLVSRATAWVASLGAVDSGALHAVTSTRAVQQLLPVHSEPEQALVAAGSWLDRFQAGETEIGSRSLRPAPLTSRRGRAADIAHAIKARDPEAAGELALGTSFDEPLRCWLRDRAAHAGVGSVQHTLKLLASAPDTPIGRSIVCRYLARSYVDFEPELESVRHIFVSPPEPV